MEFYPWLQNQDDPQQGKAQSALRTQQAGGQLLARSANAAPMDLGSQVGARRHLELSAGQRSHRLSMGSYTKA